jgi:hypothetical protein
LQCKTPLKALARARARIKARENTGAIGAGD